MLWVLLTSLLPLTAALQWTEPLTSHTQMTSCSNGDVRLPGRFTLSTGETLVKIEWIYRAESGSEETMATYSDGSFQPGSGYLSGVDWLGQAGIVVMWPQHGHGTSHYSALVTTSTHRQPHKTYSRTFNVLRGVAPTAEGGRMQARQDSKGVFDIETGQCRVALTCGVFTSLGKPAVSPVWTTPKGQTVESSSEDNGTFRLFLPNPPSGGKYNCTLPPNSPAMRCLPKLSPLLEGATVTVDVVKARATLLESIQRR